MGFLQDLFKSLSAGRTNAELAFEFIIGRMSRPQRNQFWDVLKAMEFACEKAAEESIDPRIQTAREWVRGALAALEGRR